MCILKEGKQAFGLMVANSVNTEAAFKYPITTIPLAIASTDSGLRQSDTAQLRIFPDGDSWYFRTVFCHFMVSTSTLSGIFTKSWTLLGIVMPMEVLKYNLKGFFATNGFRFPPFS